MRIETEIYKRYEADKEKLLHYGFKLQDEQYVYQKSLGKDDFYVEVIVQNNHVIAKVIDDFDQEEYVPVQLENQQGPYVSEIRQLFIAILEDIRDNCFLERPFIFSQTNRIHDVLENEYHIPLEHTFQKYPEIGVYRHESNHKWFALVQNVDQSVLGLEQQECEILNLKTDDMSCVDNIHIFPGYHMAKNSWISIIMNDQLSDEVVLDYLKKSFQLTADISHNNGNWLIPSNPKYYDIIHAFSVSDRLYWHQSGKMKVGDIVYIYSGMPDGKILFKCEIVEADLDFPGESRKCIRLKKLRYYNKYPISRELMATFNVKTVRGARYMPQPLIDEIERFYPSEE